MSIEQLELGKEYDVRVTKVLNKGVIVEFMHDPDTTGFIHISKLSRQFISDINSFISVGDTISVHVFKNGDKYDLDARGKATPERPQKDLDAMIASAEAALRDKIGKTRNTTRRRSKRGRPDGTDF